MMEVEEIKQVFIPLVQQVIQQYEVPVASASVAEHTMAILLKRLGSIEVVLERVQEVFYDSQEAITHSNQRQWFSTDYNIQDLLQFSSDELVVILISVLDSCWLYDFFTNQQQQQRRTSAMHEFHDLEVARIMGMGDEGPDGQEGGKCPLLMLGMYEESSLCGGGGSSRKQKQQMYGRGMCLLDVHQGLRRTRSELAMEVGEEEDGELDDTGSTLSDSRLYYCNQGIGTHYFNKITQYYVAASHRELCSRCTSNSFGGKSAVSKELLQKLKYWFTNAHSFPDSLAPFADVHKKRKIRVWKFFKKLFSLGRNHNTQIRMYPYPSSCSCVASNVSVRVGCWFVDAAMERRQTCMQQYY
eukprot:TRINITY_DN1270_c1_g1_i1.p2 TRINITY_DN1270_c1_g1~~TRINITY_DN1270_c1_g1_i1.p2  ORF type:complete len:356 (-),score=55.03 TRINITY_DN1270_c1_g1_i1:152-1219(-)